MFYSKKKLGLRIELILYTFNLSVLGWLGYYYGRDEFFEQYKESEDDHILRIGDATLLSYLSFLIYNVIQTFFQLNRITKSIMICKHFYTVSKWSIIFPLSLGWVPIYMNCKYAMGEAILSKCYHHITPLSKWLFLNNIGLYIIIIVFVAHTLYELGRLER